MQGPYDTRWLRNQGEAGPRSTRIDPLQVSNAVYQLHDRRTLSNNGLILMVKVQIFVHCAAACQEIHARMFVLHGRWKVALL